MLAVLLSFSAATAGSLSFSWVGLRNFATIVSDPQFHSALSNTVLFTVVSQALVVILATAGAFVLDAAFVGRRLVRFLILLPWAAPVSLAAMAWTWIFDSTFSVINWTLKVAGVLHGWFYWFGDPTLAKIAIIAVHVWRTFPFATVIVLAGRASIPRDISEAAVIDGAGFWRKLFQVEMPLLLPIVTVAVLFSALWTVVRAVMRAPDVLWLYLRTRRGVRGYIAVSRGLIAVGTGDARAALRFANEAQRIAPSEPLTLLLSAQASQAIFISAMLLGGFGYINRLLIMKSQLARIDARTHRACQGNQHSRLQSAES